MAKYVKLFDAANGSQKLLSGGAGATVSGAGVTLVDTNTAQTMTNKTFTAPSMANATITTPTMTISTATFAAIGNAIGNANAITTTYPALIFVTAADGTKGVQLPVAVAGARYIIQNDAAANAVLKVYPQVNSTINAIAANGAISMAANSTAEFIGYNATAWFTNPKVPS